MEITANEFKPAAKGQSDFYSWQLYRWLKKHKYYYRIYRGLWNSCDGYNPEKPVLYIGLRDDGCLFGNQLRRICTHGNNLDTWAFESAVMRVDEWEDVTEQFYALYRKIGVCAIHGDAWHDFDVVGDERACKRCGKIEIKQTRMVPKTEWVSQNTMPELSRKG